VEEGHSEATLYPFLSFCRKGKLMHNKQMVADMADEILARQAAARAQWSGETFEEALGAVLRTDAGRQLQELRDGIHGSEKADEWQENLLRSRAEERVGFITDTSLRETTHSAAW
jgi:transcription initiation factor TFIID subunit TAF12